MKNQAETEKPAVWGVGGQGIRVVFSLPEEVRRLVKPVAVDADIQSLICAPPGRKIRIGSGPAGDGLGADPEKLEQAFRESEEKIREKLSSVRTLLIAGGLGGGVGSEVIPALCRLAGKMNIQTLAFVTRPFGFEGKKRDRVFRESRERIEKSGAGLVCFSLDRLVGKVDDDTPHQEVFHRCDRILRDAVECAAAYLSAPPEAGGVRSGLGKIFSGPGEAVLGAESAAGPDDLVRSAKSALSSLSLTAAELAGTRGILVQIDSPGSLPFRQVEKAVGAVSGVLGERTELLYIVSRYGRPGPEITFRILAAGIPDRRSRAAPGPLPVAKTAEGARPRQEEIDFNKFTRGAFADSEPTSREGEDLDIPTFVRKGVQLDEED